jgi:hypothetical protein
MPWLILHTFVRGRRRPIPLAGRFGLDGPSISAQEGKKKKGSEREGTAGLLGLTRLGRPS